LMLQLSILRMVKLYCRKKYRIMGLFKEIWELLLSMAPYLLFGFGMAGILHIVFPDEKIYKHLSGKNLLSVLNASLLGVPLPLCSCGVIPVTAHIRKQGAGKGATLAFLVSTPTSGIDSFFATYSLLGPVFAVIRPVAAFVAGIIAGFFANKLDDETRVIPHDSVTTCNVCNTTYEKRLEHKHKFSEKLMKMFGYAYFDLVADIGKWLVLGIVIGGAISYFVPQSFIQQYLGNPLIAYPLILAFAIPLYVCTTGSIPIAASLIIKGLTPGAGLAFLIAGPATNAATITFVGGKLGKKPLIVYMMTIFFIALGFGLILDWLWDLLPGHFLLSSAGMKMLPYWLKSASAVVLIVLLVNAFYSKYKKNPSIQEVGEMAKLFRVPDMTCNHCVKSIDSALAKVDGVTNVIIDLGNKIVSVDGDVSDEAIVSAITEAGYSPEKID